MSATALAIVGPPRVAIDVDGRPLGEAAAAALVEVVVQQALSTPSLCELVFLDPPPGLGIGGALAPGTSMRVTVQGREPALFEGDVTAVELVYEPDRGRALRVRGYDRLHRLRKRQTVRALLEMTPRDLATELAAAAGLQVTGTESGPRWSRIIQDQRSDLRLLLEVTDASGLYLVVRGDSLVVLTLEGSGEPVDLVLGANLYEARLEANGEHALRGVSATGWDMARVEVVGSETSSARSGRSVVAGVDPGSDGGTGHRDLVDAGLPSAERAAAYAQGELDRATANEVVLRGVAAGDPGLRPGVPVRLAGVDGAFSGRYVLTEVRHTIDAERGYLAQLSTAVPPAVDEHRSGATAVLGRVRSVDDPDGIGRVQVTLPALRDVESSWMQVLSVGAGSGKGLVALPDVDDLVLVLLVDGDAAQGIVLGGLYGTSGPSDSGVVASSVQRYSLGTRGRQRLTLDDEAGALRLEDASGGSVELSADVVRLQDAAGSVVELTTAGVRVHSAGDIQIDAPGHSVRIRGSSVDFETG